jgi:hypothetical protein
VTDERRDVAYAVGTGIPGDGFLRRRQTPRLAVGRSAARAYARLRRRIAGVPA